MIHYLYSPNHKRHYPPHEVFNGDYDTAQEIPDRATSIFKALNRERFKRVGHFSSVPRSILSKIHNAKYLKFLKATCEDLGTSEYLYPSVWSYTPGAQYPTNGSQVALLGSYIFDTYTPLLRNTYATAIESASLAYSAAKLIHTYPEETFYALCRPPGHHATAAMAGGYCYINNAAVAAEYLSKYGKVAILDVDFHHGNGTQHIFYERNDVLTVSIHADPNWKFPFYSGFADEIGVGEGKGFNRNYPLPKGTADKPYDQTLQKALANIHKFQPRYLIVSYGADTHIADPIGGFQLSTNYFTQMGKKINSIAIPTVIVQEGGYNNEHLGKNVTAFLKGFV